MTRKKSPQVPPAPADEPELKERVIHTRVPESLETELRERAQTLGISVSNLVRNVLGHAFGLVGDVVADSHAIARAARGDRERSPPVPEVERTSERWGAGTVSSAISDVIAWQAIELAKNAVCARCNELLPKNRDAAIGTTEHGGARVIVCTPCFEELRR